MRKKLKKITVSEQGLMDRRKKGRLGKRKKEGHSENLFEFLGS